jgi:Rad3-related DNA helicase
LFQKRTEAGPASQQAKGTQSPVEVEQKTGETLAKIFAEDGPLSAVLTGFSPRPEQLKMAHYVEKSLTEKSAVFIEAGTGSGKTLAYVVPLVRAVGKGTRPAVIATRTKNLQDQLIEHDIPIVLSALKVKRKVASLKGRRNYLCASRLEQVLNRTARTSAEAWLLIKLVGWIDRGESSSPHHMPGDLERLNISHQDAHLLRHLHADALSCRRICARGKGKYECPYQRARREAEGADLIVTNHSLLAQRSLGEAVFPIHHLVIDEAHHLEEAFRQATRRDFSDHRVAEVAAPFIHLGSHLSGDKEDSRHSVEVSGAGSSSLQRSIVNEAKGIALDHHQILVDCQSFLMTHAPSGRLRLTDSLRRNTDWQRIVQAGANLTGRMKFLCGLAEGSVSKPGSSEDLIRDAVREVERLSIEFSMFLSGSSERIQWLEAKLWPPEGKNGAGDNIELHDVALSIKPAVANLISRAGGTILTSATLTVGGSFVFLRDRLGLKQEEGICIGSSFNYREQMLIYVVDDGPIPSDPSYSRQTARHLTGLATLLSGRVLGLFTSTDSVREAYFSTIKGLNKAKIRLLAQKITGGRHNIMSHFRQVPSTILLGTYSFWEGIDVPGDSLSCVMINKLPFAPPTDPILNAIAEAEKLNEFQELAVPYMTMKLRQGIGRLIRTSTDRGAVVILDGRFLNASYGDTVLKSLPPATVHIGSGATLRETLRTWFGPSQLTKWEQELKEQE